MRFEWDDKKNVSNLRKHGIDFSEASAVFDDPNCEFLFDRNSYGEDRWHAIGFADAVTVLILVAHTYRDDDDGTEVVRLISARAANAKERKLYGNGQV